MHSSWIARQFLNIPNSAGTVESRQTGLEHSLEYSFVEEEASPDASYVSRQFLNVPNSTGTFKRGWITLENSFKFGNTVVEREEAVAETSFVARRFLTVPNSTGTAKSGRANLDIALSLVTTLSKERRRRRILRSEVDNSGTFGIALRQ